MDKIRLRFTGITAYGATLVTTITGLIFTLIITRRLSPEELGVWRYIGTLITYFIIPAGLLTYWATRFTAAGEKLLKTLLTITIATSALATIVFIISSQLFAAAVNFPISAFIAAALEIPSIYAYMTFEAVAYAKKPHINYVAQLIQEFLKIPVAVILVIIMRLGLLGAIIAVVVAYAGRSLTLAFLLREMEWGKLSTKIAIKMASVSWLPLYQSGASAILALDTLVVIFLTGSSEAVGYSAAVLLIGSLLSATGTLAAGLYPKMLQQISGKDVETSISLVFMLAIPIAFGVLILGEPLLNILRPEYSAAAQVLPIAIIHGILYVFSGIMDAVISGSERVDFKENFTFRELVKSRLFLLPTLNYINAAMYIPALAVAMILTKPTNPLTILTTWLTMNLVTYTPFVFYKTMVAHKSVNFSFPAKTVTNYLVSSALMGITVFLLKPEQLPVEIIPALAQTTPAMIIGAATYFTVLYIIDKEFRNLVAAILHSIA